MSDTNRLDREFLKSALTLASQTDVDHLLVITDTTIAPEKAAKTVGVATPRSAAIGAASMAGR